MERIKILRKEIEEIKKDKSNKIFVQLMNNEKIDYLNNQLQVIDKKLEITNILLEDELGKRYIQEIIGRPPNPNIEKQKSIVDMIVANKEYISPTILGMYGKNIDTQENPDSIKEENKINIEDVKVNINQYLDEENDSDYEDQIIEKLKNLDITKDKDSVDVKPNVPPPVVVNQGQTSSSGSNVTNPNQSRNWRIHEEEQSNPLRKNIDRRQYYMRKTSDYIPMKYVPYDKEPQALNPTGIYLDLDCVEDREKMINMWIKENGAVINREGMTKEQGIEFLRRTMRGSVERFIESLGDNYETLKNNSENILRYLSNLENLIRREFLGVCQNQEGNPWDLDRENAIKGMMNISLCNMCYFDQYTCEYTDWFYKGRFKEYSTEYEFYCKMFYEKLPEPFRTRIIKDFAELLKEGRITNPSLGARRMCRYVLLRKT